MHINCLMFFGLMAVSGAAMAASSTTSQPAQVRTHRSDGAMFPAVSQTVRTQQRRKVRVSSSTQGLSNRTKVMPSDEPARGGVFVTPAHDHSTQNPRTVTPIVILPRKAQPNQKYQ